MRATNLRSFALLASQTVSTRSGRFGAEISSPSIRPLHASPIFHQPRRRDFFSSNSVLSASRQPLPEATKEPAAKESDQGQDHSHSHNPTRKTVRSPAAKTSLRRVAVEAQRSKDGNLVGARSGRENPIPRKLVTAYAVAEQFDLARVVEILRSKGYEPDPLGTRLYPQVVHVQVPVSSIHRSSNPSAEGLSSTEVGDVFIFPSGTLVTWSLPEGFTSYLATRTLLPATENPHTDSTETEDLEYIEDPNLEHSVIRGETIVLGTKPNTSSPNSSDLDTTLTKIAFSSGFARSTKLAVLETLLSSYLTSTSSIPQLLAHSTRLPTRISRPFILRKTGHLLSLRAQLNLYSELTDSLPDLFWDSRHELQLENYYDQVGRALDVGIRIKVLNEKMDYAAEIARVLRETLSERHGLFLEWTIIVLIAIEVGFEVLRLWKEGFWEDVWAGDVKVNRKSKRRQEALVERDTEREGSLV